MRTTFIIVLLFSTSIAVAHPMGNFSINHYSAISIAEKGLQIEYIIDLAEIPTFQEMEKWDMKHDKQASDQAQLYAKDKARELARGLLLQLNNRAVPLKVVRSAMNVVPGAGGLPTLMIRVQYFAGWDTNSLTGENSVEFKDHNYSGRIGWKEIVIRKSGAASVSQTDQVYIDRSKQLTEYPQDPTNSPPQETEASFRFTLSQAFSVKNQPKVELRKQEAVSEEQVPRVMRPVREAIPDASISKNSRAVLQYAPTISYKRDDAFTRLITAQNLTRDVIFFSLLVAFALGAMHALSPGHGKAIVAGYLVGSRGTARHALFLGAVVTLTHTIGVFALGLITLFGSRYILPEELYPWLGFVSGLSIVIIGLSLFWKRFRSMREKQHQDQVHAQHHVPTHHQHHIHHHEHSSQHHDHGHSHGHDHSHLPVDTKPGVISWRSLLTVGVSGGALPCPSALVVLLSAISLHRIGFGLLLIVAFSLGLAVVLTSIGILFVHASNWTQRFRFGGALLYRLPVFSSLLISIVGFAIAIQSLMRV